MPAITCGACAVAFSSSGHGRSPPLPSGRLRKLVPVTPRRLGLRLPAPMASTVDSPGSSSDFAKRMDRAWLISKQLFWRAESSGGEMVEPLTTEDFDVVLTHVGGSSLFLEFGMDAADEVFDEPPLKDVMRDEEIVDHVLTCVGGLSLFLEPDLEMSCGEGYDTTAWQWLTMLLGYDHVVFIEVPHNDTPRELPSQENIMMWQLFGKYHHGARVDLALDKMELIVLIVCLANGYHG